MTKLTREYNSAIGKLVMDMITDLQSLKTSAEVFSGNSDNVNSIKNW